MSEYTTETRSVPLIDVPPKLRNALVTHADRKKLLLVATKVWLTIRTNGASSSLVGKLLKRRANSADPDPFHEMVVILHETHLIVGTNGAKRGTTARSIALTAATLKRESDGLTIGGFADEPKTHFVALANSEAIDAIEAAKAQSEKVTSASITEP